jgi:hypothetical protein
MALFFQFADLLLRCPCDAFLVFFVVFITQKYGELFFVVCTA